MKPSEPSSRSEGDIRPAPEREISESPYPQPIPAKEPGWENRVLPSLELPDPACRFSGRDALILIGSVGRRINDPAARVRSCRKPACQVQRSLTESRRVGNVIDERPFQRDRPSAVARRR